ncbi:MAG: DUF3524 domain-containing protein [Planctomycetota bacterium]|nr:DUF3524 domain-containing protein [Planctomycetota bacterium]
MSSQLDILALEPFYGGVRRTMLETLIRCSRHRWTLLKLPPRRIERRLSAAAHWFAEQLSRHWIGRLDVLFTSEAMNLADLVRHLPNLAHKPSVVYFHNNQLPDPDRPLSAAPHELTNMSTAQAATELWFNSEFHQQLFSYRASALVDRHRELSSRNPMANIIAKSRVMPPPIDLHPAVEMSQADVDRRRRSIFVDTRDTDMDLLNDGLSMLSERGERFELFTVGPVDDFSESFARTTISESDDVAQTAGMSRSSVFLSTRRFAPVDHYAVRALAAKCWPVVPEDGVYVEMIPTRLHECCLYDGTPDGLASRIQDAWHLYDANDAKSDFQTAVHNFDAMIACKAMDERLSELAARGVFAKQFSP